MSKSFVPFLICVAAVTNAVGAGVEGSALAQEPVLKGASPVVQFGAPNESKYVFCFDGECPGYTRKTIRVVEPEPANPAPVVDADLALDEREELVQPVVPKKVKKVKRRIASKVKPRMGCAAPATSKDFA